MAQTGLATLTPEVVSNLAVVLTHLASADNAARAAAEQQLNEAWLLQQPGLLLATLANFVARNADPTMRSFAAVLLRRLALKEPPHQSTEIKHSYYVVIGDEYRGYIQSELLSSLQSESVAQVRRKVCDTISELASHMAQKGSMWMELLQAIFQCSKAPSAEHRVSALQIIANVPALITDQDAGAVLPVFIGAFQDGTPQVRLEALKASVAYMLELDDVQRAKCAELIPQMLNVLPPLVHDEDSLKEALSYMVELAEWAPKTLRPVLSQLIDFVAAIMRNAELDFAPRQTASELLVTLSEAAAPMVRKNGHLSSTIVPILLEWMASVEDSETWYTTEEEDDDADEMHMVASVAMDRLAIALGGKSILPVAFTFIPQMLGSEDWRKRHAAVMAISAIAEGCAKIMEAELDRIMRLILPYLRDAHPRVRWAAANAVGQLSTDFAPVPQKNFHEMIMTSLVPCMDDTVARVQAHAAAALVNFCEEMEKDAIVPYLDAVFGRLITLLKTGKTYVQEQAITTIGTVADSAEGHFRKYYSDIMPLLISVLKGATQKEFRLLRGKTMECASLIALNVGKETFAPNAEEFIGLLRQTQASITEADDPQSSYLLAAWARMCKVMGQDFLPLLDIVLPPLIHSAQLRPDFVDLDGVEDYEDKFDPEEGWEFVEVEGKRIGIKNTVLDEKCTAVEMFICYARELGAGFHPYVDKILSIVVPLLKFYYHEDVRHAAAATIPLLLISLQKANYPLETIMVKWHDIAQKLIEVIAVEVEPGFLCQAYVTFQECIDVVGPHCMTEELCHSFTEATISQLKDYFQRIQARVGARKDTDYDAEDEEALQDEESNDDFFISELSKVFHSVLKAQGPSFLPFFDRLVEIADACVKSSEVGPRQWALCAYDDVLEYTGPAAARYLAHISGPFIQSLVDPAEDIRQSAAYGIGVAAQFGGEHFWRFAADALPNLFVAINAPAARQSPNNLATENAISAVGKICHFCGASGLFDVNSVLSAWLAALPIVEDDQEVAHTYTYLIDLMESNHPAIMGPNLANLPKLVSILVEVLATPELLAEKQELGNRIVGSLRKLLSQCNDETKGTLWNGLAPERRKFLVDQQIV